MDKKQFKEMKTKQAPELKKEAQILRDKLWQLRVDLNSGKVKNVREIRSIRKDIARILTIVNSYEKK
ncbi:MAG: 50S ribosomal protein L29 [Parcubacteria group bacterium]|nr:50S ribosomal protein L29 [Parcubacteria group bacterium]